MTFSADKLLASGTQGAADPHSGGNGYRPLFFNNGTQEGEMGANDRQSAFMLSYCCAVLERIKSWEKPKSAKWNRLNNVEEQFYRCLDIYRLEKWDPEDIKKAEELFKTMDRKIKKLWPSAP